MANFNFVATANLPNVRETFVRIIFESLINNPRFTRDELVATDIYVHISISFIRLCMQF